MKNNKVKLCIFVQLIIFVFFFTNCKQNKKQEGRQLSNVIVNNNIRYDSVFKKLNMLNEFIFPSDYRDIQNKRSCDILYYTGNLNDIRNNDNIRKYKCTAHFYKSDTLYIMIGYSDGFSSHGFIINYINKKFYTKIHSSNDMVSDNNDNLPIYNTIYQKLILDKYSYQVGDSIFGKVDFKIQEYDNDSRNEYNGKGYFRAKIIKL